MEWGAGIFGAGPLASVLPKRRAPAHPPQAARLAVILPAPKALRKRQNSAYLADARAHHRVRRMATHSCREHGLKDALTIESPPQRLACTQLGRPRHCQLAPPALLLGGATGLILPAPWRNVGPMCRILLFVP